MICYLVPVAYYFIILIKMMRHVISEILVKIGHLLIYIPVKSIKICMKIINFLRADQTRLITFLALFGILVLSRKLVNKAARIRI